MVWYDHAVSLDLHEILKQSESTEELWQVFKMLERTTLPKTVYKCILPSRTGTVLKASCGHTTYSTVYSLYSFTLFLTTGNTVDACCTKQLHVGRRATKAHINRRDLDVEDILVEKSISTKLTNIKSLSRF